MRIFVQILKFILGMLLIALAHLVVLYLFPSPLNHIHTIFIAIVMVLFLYEHGSIVWFGAFLFLLLDFPSLHPFGLSLIAGTIATTSMLLLYRTLFTNRSLFAAVALMSSGYIIYRLCYIVYEIGAYVFTHASLQIKHDIGVYTVELLFTVFALSVTYFIASKFSFQLQHTQVNESWFRNLPRTK